MKRSKIFLGVTTAILAVAGVAASKHYTATTRFYLTAAATNPWCLSHTSICKTAISGSQCFLTLTIDGVATQYPLYTKGPVNNSGTRCTTNLLYTTSEGK